MNKFRFPIAFKLVGITVSLLITITFMIAIQSAQFFEKEIRETHEQSNQTQAANRATEIESLLQSYTDKIRMVASLMYKKYSNPQEREDAINITFRPDRDFVSVEIHELVNGQFQFVDRVVNSDYLAANQLSSDYIQKLRTDRPFPVSAVFAGKIEVQNSTIPKGLALITVGIPFVKDAYDQVTHVAIADIKLEKIQKAFSSLGASEIFLVDSAGRVIAHPEDEYTVQGYLLDEIPIVQSAMTSKLKSNHLPRFTNPLDGKEYYGVYHKTSFGVSVVAQIPEEVILEPARQVQREAYYAGGLVLSIALFFVFLFSISLTSPIEKLLELTFEVAKGNFDIDAAGKIKSRDEVNDLALAFDKMTTGLKALVKTQGADVAKTLMESDLEKMGGSKKQVAVLFSDLRDFTKFSEGHTPEEVVEMLNEYFEIMVGCIERNKGRVNKFIGDAIMAMWGAPSSTGNDEYGAVRAALEMRIELNKLNERRIGRGQGPIKIGVGIHCGEAVAGTIGSKSRLEYTIIGDTVNQASRLEASTKAFGADLLISDETVQKVKDHYMIEYAGAAEVKGKAEPLKMYRVRGFIDEKGEQQPIRTPYSDFEAQDADKVKVSDTPPAAA